IQAQRVNADFLEGFGGPGSFRPRFFHRTHGREHDVAPGWENEGTSRTWPPNRDSVAPGRCDAVAQPDNAPACPEPHPRPSTVPLVQAVVLVAVLPPGHLARLVVTLNPPARSLGSDRDGASSGAKFHPFAGHYLGVSLFLFPRGATMFRRIREITKEEFCAE